MSAIHQAFVNSGKKAGLEVWRIEEFAPVPVPTTQYGNFYSGDSYIVLSTIGKKDRFSWHIHFWLGSSTTQDEAGAAAFLAVNLDDYQFHGSAVQHREVQGYESRQFLEYFPPAIHYLGGGHASGFSHVTINPGAEKRLFQIKGRRNVRVKQVEASVTSLNKGDCFILDVDHQIYVFVGEHAKSVERLKADTVAKQIRDQDHHGRATVEIIDMASPEEDYKKFFDALGSGDMESIAEATEGGDDEEFERVAIRDVTLSEISDRTGTMMINNLPAPFTKEQLDSKECYILDTGSYSGIYVWVGRDSNEKEKTEAMKNAEKYLKQRNYPAWVPVTRIPEGVEPTAFMQYFEDWN